MTNKELKEKMDLALSFPSVYARGTFGWCANDAMKQRSIANGVSDTRRQLIIDCPKDGFIADCCGIVKAFLWGWNANHQHNYGGASYGANGVPDVNEDGLLNACSDVSTDMSNIEVGELMWLDGHCGLYYGDGKVFESNTSPHDGIQLNDINAHGWKKHGKLPWVEYVKDEAPKVEEPTPVVEEPQKVEEPTLSVGDKVRMSKEATVYGTNKKYMSFVYNSDLYVREINGDRVVISVFKAGAITGAVEARFLTKV